jgi:hypothetical protein
MPKLALANYGVHTTPIARRIGNRLADHYGTGSVARILCDTEALSDVDVLIVIIGECRIEASNGLRITLERALRSRTPVLCVLINGARMPGNLPGRTTLTAAEINTGPRFDGQVDGLIRLIGRTLLIRSAAPAVTLAEPPIAPLGLPRALAISQLLGARMEARVRTTLWRPNVGLSPSEPSIEEISSSPSARPRSAMILRETSLAEERRLREELASFGGTSPATGTPPSLVVQQPPLPDLLSDLVDFSAFAPERGAAGSEVLVQVFLHQLDDAAIAEERARAADRDAVRRGVATLVTEIARGKRVDVLIEGRRDRRRALAIRRLAGQTLRLPILRDAPCDESQLHVQCGFRRSRPGIPR